MTKPEILEKTPVSLAQIKGVLGSLKKRDEELSFRGTKTEEYVNNVVMISKKQAEELSKKLIGLEIPRLKEEHIIKIIDILPRSEAELKVILQGYTITVSADSRKKIMDVVKDFLPKKR